MKRLILLVPMIIILLGCAQNEIVCDAPYVSLGGKCCLDENSNQVCDSEEGMPADDSVAGPADKEVQDEEIEGPDDEAAEAPPEVVEATMAGENIDIGYLPLTTVVNEVTEGNSVSFDQAKVEILGVWNNAITTRVFGAIIGEKFTVAKDKPVDVHTRDGRIRMDFRDNNVLYIDKVVD